MNWYPLIGMYAGVFAYLALVSKMNTMRNSKRIKKELELQHLREKHLKRLHIFMSFAGQDNNQKENMLEMMWRTQMGREEAKIKHIDEQIANL